MESCKKVDGNRYLLSEEETAIMCISNEQCRHVRNSIWLFTGRMLFLAGMGGQMPDSHENQRFSWRALRVEACRSKFPREEIHR